MIIKRQQEKNQILPLVSIIVPVYNTEKFLKECLDSLLAQTYPNFEIVIVNDASPDNSEAIIQEYLKRYPEKIQYIKKAKNEGLAAARNTGIKAAKGQYIAFCDSDDVWLPEKLEIQMQEFFKDPDLDVVYSDCFLIFEDKKTNQKLTEFWGVKQYSGYIFEKLFKKGNFLYDLGVLKKDIFQKVGLFSEDLRCVEDYEFFLRVALEGYKFKSIKKPLWFYRIREESLSKNKEEMKKHLIKVYENIYKQAKSKIKTKQKIKNLQKIFKKKIKDVEKWYLKWKLNYLIEKFAKDNDRKNLFLTQLKIFFNFPGVRNFLKIFILPIWPKLILVWREYKHKLNDGI